MKFILLKVIYCLAVNSIASAQIWDTYFWLEDDDDEYKDENRLWPDDIDYNDTSLRLIQLSSADLLEEHNLLSESSEIIIDEIVSMVREDLIETHANHINQIISEHSLNLYNVLHQIRKHEHESGNIRKLRFHDINIWSNESESKINELFGDEEGSYYES